MDAFSKKGASVFPTRDHSEIRRWAEAHDAVPAEVLTLKFDGEPTTLHFLRGDAKDGTPELRPISWEDFFARFDLLELSMAFDDESGRFNIVRVEKPIQQRFAN